MNPNRNVRIEKVTLNIGAGKDQALLEKGIKLLKAITEREPVKTITMKRIATWGLRPRLPIGCKVTLRGQAAKEVLQRLFAAKDNKISAKQLDEKGNLAFGIHEYIDIPGVKYNPDIGIMGLEVCVTFERPGYRIKRRRLRQRKIPSRHRVTKQEAMELLAAEFKVAFAEEEK